MHICMKQQKGVVVVTFLLNDTQRQLDIQHHRKSLKGPFISGNSNRTVNGLSGVIVLKLMNKI